MKEENNEVYKCINKLIQDVLAENTPLELLQATRKLFDKLLEIVQPIVPLDPDQQDLFLQSGKALSPYSAASSIKDLYRTRRFMLGLLEAVKDIRTKNPNKVAQIMYAGTGPFAILAFPVMLAFSAQEVRFSLLDIHQDALKALSYLLVKMGLTDRIEEMVCTDATEYTIPKDKNIDIVITETMQRALVRETQFGITLHLASQIHEEAIWIPESIIVDVGLVNKKKDIERMMDKLNEGDSHFYQLGTLLNLSKTSAPILSRQINQEKKNIDFPTISLPEEVINEYSMLTLLTTVRIYGHHVLAPYESSITLPHELKDLRLLDKMPSAVEITYQTENDPVYTTRFK